MRFDSSTGRCRNLERGVPGHGISLIGVVCLSLTALSWGDSGTESAITADPSVISWDGTSGISLNSFVGADTFYNVGVFGQGTFTANVEGGRIWNGHDWLTTATDYYVPVGAAGDYDWHATAVGSVIAAYDPNQADPYPYYKLGMAPSTTLSSGAIASGFGADGSFDITEKTFYDTYNHYFTGSFSRTLSYGGLTYSFSAPTDVINSSWGGDDPSGSDVLTRTVDAMAYAQPLTSVVFSAGNSSSSASLSNNVGGPASGFNGISVGATGDGSALNYGGVAGFSSRGPQDYYDPVNGLVTGVRAPVTLVAPGTNVLGAYYGGATGSNTGGTDPSGGATSWYEYGLAGTSFSAPLVSGGISLMKSTSYIIGMGDTSRDARVIKAVLMTSADKLAGWDNGQHVVAGVSVTTQSLDWTQGAGQLNLNRAFGIYTGNNISNQAGTADVAGFGGGDVSWRGWDFGKVHNGFSNDYHVLTEALAGQMFDVSLSWFREYGTPVFTDNADPNTQTIVVGDSGFTNLDLQIWNADFTVLLAESKSQYNSVEHLYFQLPQAGQYGIRVVDAGQVFGTENADGTSYGLSWDTVTVPEPTGGVLCLVSCAVLLFRRPDRARQLRRP
jgi:hypothetical protein